MCAYEYLIDRECLIMNIYFDGSMARRVTAVTDVSHYTTSGSFAKYWLAQTSLRRTLPRAHAVRDPCSPALLMHAMHKRGKKFQQFKGQYVVVPKGNKITPDDQWRIHHRLSPQLAKLVLKDPSKAHVRYTELRKTHSDVPLSELWEGSVWVQTPQEGLQFDSKRMSIEDFARDTGNTKSPQHLSEAVRNRGRTSSAGWGGTIVPPAESNVVGYLQWLDQATAEHEDNHPTNSTRPAYAGERRSHLHNYLSLFLPSKMGTLREI